MLEQHTYLGPAQPNKSDMLPLVALLRAFGNMHSNPELSDSEKLSHLLPVSYDAELWVGRCSRSQNSCPIW